MAIGADPTAPEAPSLTYDQGVLREIVRRARTPGCIAGEPAFAATD